MPSILGSRFRLDWAAKPFGIFLDPELPRRGRWIALSALIGTVSGVGAIFFDAAFRLAQWLFLEKIGGFLPPASGLEGGSGYPPSHPWLLPISLVIGGLLAGALVFGLAPEAEGHGTDAVIKAFHHGQGRIRRRVPIVKALASAITIGSGGSGGREGPIAQIGAGFGSALADALKLSDRDRRIMMLAGVAGGIGSIFRAPLGAAFFSAEVLYSEPEFEYLALLPGLISAIVGYCVYCAYAGWGFLFDVPPISFHQPEHLIVYALLGLACGLIGVVYPMFFYGVRDRIFRPLRAPLWIKPAIGALLLGGIAVFFPQALGMGYGYIQQAIQGDFSIRFLLVFAALKIVATSLTISSGGSGGVFGPSLVIGGAIGAAFGRGASLLLPSLAPDPIACTMVGMGGFFAGVAKVPFASVIMVMEMTGTYGLLVPSLLVASIAYLFLPLRVRLYENQLRSRSDSPANAGTLASDLLGTTKVKDCWTPRSDPPSPVTAEAGLSTLASLAEAHPEDLIAVTDASGRLVGEISYQDIRQDLLDAETLGRKRVRDRMQRLVGPLTPEDDLATAARLLSLRPVDAVLVVRASDGDEVLGSFTRRDLILAYGRRMASLQQEVESEFPSSADLR